MANNTKLKMFSEIQSNNKLIRVWLYLLFLLQLNKSYQSISLTILNNSKYRLLVHLNDNFLIL